MAVIANTKKVTMSLVSEVVVTVLVRKRITLADLSVVSDVALELGIPNYATFTYDPARDYPLNAEQFSRITFKWSKKDEYPKGPVPKPKTLPSLPPESYTKKSYKSIYGKDLG